MGQQLFFDLSFDKSPDPPPERPSRVSRRRLMRAVLRWLYQADPPTGAAEGVVTRISRIRADVAAFWSRPSRNPHGEGPSRILTPARTAVYQCYADRDAFWPDASRSEQILPRLQQFRSEMAELEDRIRREEPELRADGTLFEELAEWRYDRSRNPEYHRLRRQIDRAEHALYCGTKFERVRSADLADRLYLAVPADLIGADELADGWGLLWVHDDLSVALVAEAEPRECLPANRLHLVQNIAAAAAGPVLFASGVRRQKLGRTIFVKRPRGHRKPEPGTARD